MNWRSILHGKGTKKNIPAVFFLADIFGAGHWSKMLSKFLKCFLRAADWCHLLREKPDRNRAREVVLTVSHLFGLCKIINTGWTECKNTRYSPSSNINDCVYDVAIRCNIAVNCTLCTLFLFLWKLTETVPQHKMKKKQKKLFDLDVDDWLYTYFRGCWHF